MFLDDMAMFQGNDNKKNETPLHIAALNNSKEIGEILISKRADINAKHIIYLKIKILFLIKII